MNHAAMFDRDFEDERLQNKSIRNMICSEAGEKSRNASDDELDDLLLKLDEITAESNRSDVVTPLMPTDKARHTTPVGKSDSNVVILYPSSTSTVLPTKIPLTIDGWEKQQARMVELSDEALAEKVRTLSMQPAKSGIGLVPYTEIREEFCALNIELNNRKRLAPRFRYMRRSHDFANGIKEELLLKDRIVLDLHWLHCRGERRAIKVPGSVDPAFASLMLSPNFDFEAAWRFASIEKKMPTRATWLKLTEDLAWQLATIESKEKYRHFYTVMYGDMRVGKSSQIGYYDVKAILESNVPNRLKANIPIWADIWMCNRILRTDGVKPTMSKVAALHAVASGRSTPLDRKDVESRLISCERYIRE